MPSNMTKVTCSREVALAVLEDVRAGSFCEHALSQRLDAARDAGPEDRALAAELSYGVLRWLFRLDAMVKRCSDHPPARLKPAVRQILRLALYQIFMLDRIPDHAAVDQAVTQARTRFGNKTASFVNAVLRNAIRNRRAVDPEPSSDTDSLSVYFSHPSWLVKRWIKDLGLERTRQVLAANNTPSELFLRVNTIKSSVEDPVALLRESGHTVERLEQPETALLLKSVRGPVQSLPGYREGLFAVQDAASQMIAPLLGAKAGDRILDACAAPGGKTAHLAALAGNEAQLVAAEIDPVRLQETDENLQRLAVKNVTLVLGDSSDEDFVRNLGAFDRILVDASCSNLGVLRRNPEARYRSRPKDIVVLAQRQLKMLTCLAPILKPGGVLLYSVCTITAEETRDVVSAFLNNNPEYERSPIGTHEVPVEGLVHQDGCFSTFPPPHDMLLDGFFAARLRRRP